MKKSIFTLGLIASSLLFANATTSIKKSIAAPAYEITNTTVYQFTVKTTTGVITGTADTLAKANTKIDKIAENATILQKEITVIPLTTNENLERIYTWGVVTDNGYATGTASSLSKAENTIELIKSTDVEHSNIIESYKTVK